MGKSILVLVFFGFIAAICAEPNDWPSCGPPWTHKSQPRSKEGKINLPNEFVTSMTKAILGNYYLSEKNYQFILDDPPKIIKARSETYNEYVFYNIITEIKKRRATNKYKCSICVKSMLKSCFEYQLNCVKNGAALKKEKSFYFTNMFCSE